MLESLANLATLLAVIVAACAVVPAFRALRLAAAANRAQIVVNILDAYAATDVLAAMRSLRKWRTENGPEFAERFAAKRETDVMWQLDADRRVFKLFMLKVHVHLIDGLVSESFLKRFLTASPVGLLLEVVEPIEAAINSSYDREMFADFRRRWATELDQDRSKFS
jgi:hypothetical protein